MCIDQCGGMIYSCKVYEVQCWVHLQQSNDFLDFLLLSSVAALCFDFWPLIIFFYCVQPGAERSGLVHHAGVSRNPPQPDDVPAAPDRCSQMWLRQAVAAAAAADPVGLVRPPHPPPPDAAPAKSTLSVSYDTQVPLGELLPGRARALHPFHLPCGHHVADGHTEQLGHYWQWSVHLRRYSSASCACSHADH